MNKPKVGEKTIEFTDIAASKTPPSLSAMTAVKKQQTPKNTTNIFDQKSGFFRRSFRRKGNSVDEITTVESELIAEDTVDRVPE